MDVVILNIVFQKLSHTEKKIGFVAVSKNSARYRFENLILLDHQNNCIGRSNQLLKYQNFLHEQTLFIMLENSTYYIIILRSNKVIFRCVPN